MFKKVKKILPYILIVLAIFVYFNRTNSVTALVRRVELESRQVRKTVSASGFVKSLNEADLSFVSTGEIKGISVVEGDIVKKGQTLAYIDSSFQQQAVQSYKDARDTRLRQKELFEEEEKSNTRLLGGEDAYNIKLREYDEAISQAEASYQSQLALLSNYYIYAPFDGTIVDVYKENGELATTGVPIIKIANLDEVVFEVIVDQEDYALLKQGQDVEIDLDAYTNSFTGNVEKLPLNADINTGGFVIKSSFDSGTEDVKLGMTGDAFIITDKTDDSAQALIFNEISYDEDDDPFVWVVENGKIKKVPVELGLEGDIYTEIKTDLSGKEIVVPASDTSVVEEGFKAKIIN